MKVEIYVVTHKSYKMPKKDNIYVPVQVGFGKKIEKFQRDNTGLNIYKKNESYCELTAQYWAWKNRKVDIKGLVHYRRLFLKKKKYLMKFNYKNILGKSDIEDCLEYYDIILPKKRNYYVDTIGEHYIHSHKEIGLDILKEVLKNNFPLYYNNFIYHMNEKKGHMFNMFIARSRVFDEYSYWLFDVLGEVEKKVDITKFSKSEKRIYGYLGELLLDVWISTKKLNYYEFPVAFVEGENVLKKGFGVIKRKYFRKKII
jgi:hypothetical protein